MMACWLLRICDVVFIVYETGHRFRLRQQNVNTTFVTIETTIKHYWITDLNPNTCIALKCWDYRCRTIHNSTNCFFGLIKYFRLTIWLLYSYWHAGTHGLWSYSGIRVTLKSDLTKKEKKNGFITWKCRVACCEYLLMLRHQTAFWSILMLMLSLLLLKP